MDVNKDSSLNAKARTKDFGFVLKDNQGPRPRTTSQHFPMTEVYFGKSIGIF